MEIEQLPDSLLLQVFKHLMFRDVCICARVCRRWWRVAHDPTLQRAINAQSTPLSARKASSLIRAYGGHHLVELRITGKVHMSHYRRKERVFSSKFFKHLGRRCPSLEVLYITDGYLASNSITTMTKISDLPPTLVKLSLRNSFFHPAEFFRVDPGRPAPPRLKLLDLSLCSLVSSVELRKIDQLPKLQALSLECCYRVNDGGISNMLHLMARLVILDIEGTEITDRGLSMVIRYGVHLTVLFAGHTKVTGEAFGEALPHIAHRLESSEGLKMICLRRTCMREEYLPKLLEVAPRLKIVTVTSHDMSADVKARFELSVPKSCTILECCAWYDSEVIACEHFKFGIFSAF